MREIIEAVHVNVPFSMLNESYLDFFLKHGLNPEIGFDCNALEGFGLPVFKRIANRLHERGLEITLHGPFMDLSPGSPDPDVRALTRRRFEQMLRLVPVFKPKTVVCHAGYDWKRYYPSRDQWVELSLGFWSWVGKRIQDEGGRLMLENVYEDGPEDIRILFEKLEDRQVGFCLDTGHQAVFSNSSMETWIDSLGVYLGQVHLHDNRGLHDEHLALGLGTIDFDALFDRLKARGASFPIITLEPHREKDFWPSIRYLKKFWPWPPPRNR